MNAVIHSPVLWYGGKGGLLAKIAPFVNDQCRVYCEPFCGGASIFFMRRPVTCDVINDINVDLINLYRVLKDSSLFRVFKRMVEHTPYARAELDRALSIWRKGSDDPVLKAWAFFVRCNQAVSGVPALTIGNWSRSFVSGGDVAASVNRWLMRLSMLDAWNWRLSNTVIECRDGIDVIADYDSDETLFYVDPPYVQETRVKKVVYAGELSIDDHQRLVDRLLKCRGKVVLSGYRHEAVHSRLEAAGWKRIDFKTVCQAAGKGRGTGLQGKGVMFAKVPRIESVWLNQSALDKSNLRNTHISRTEV